jgi:tetratricopeptide (TPR) repeat protein
VVFITGGPGQGKTALLDAFAHRAMEEHSNLLVASGNCNAYSGLGDPYLPFRDLMAMLTGDVEARWDAGAVTRDHARRLWAAMPIVVNALLDRGPNLVDVLVPGAALLSRSLAAGQGDAPWLTRLREHIRRHAAGLRGVEQAHLFQQVTDALRTIAEEQPLVLILDDLQWADAASIGLLFHLVRRLANTRSRALIACAYRPEEVSMGRAGQRHPLAKPLNEFKRAFGDVWVDLDSAERAEGRRFVDALLDAEPNRLTERFRDAMSRRTEGHPLFTVELLRAMQERGDLRKDKDGCWIEGSALDWEALPARVEAVIEERIDRLDPELQEMLTVASVEGEVFIAQVVAEVLQWNEKTTQHRLAGELARRHRLVMEQEELHSIRGRLSHYRFGHVLFRDYLYNRLGSGERRLLHAKTAVALAKAYEGQLDEIAVQLAHHFRHAGDRASAIQYSILAAERAARIFANDEAMTHYSQAIALADGVSLDVPSLAKLHRGRGLACERVGAFDQARADHEEALRIARAAGERQVEWRALLDLGRLWASRDYSQTRRYFEDALELARVMDAPAVLADSLNWIGNWHMNDGDPNRAVAYHLEALSVMQILGDRRGLANTLDLLGIAHLMAGDLGASARCYDRAIESFRELDERPRLVTSLTGRGFTVSTLTSLASVPAIPRGDATSDLDEALRIAGEIGSAPDEAWACMALGELHLVRGRFGCALEILRTGLRIASEIGHREFILANRFALGMVYTELFALEEARGQLEEALAMARDLRSHVLAHSVSGALAGAWLMIGDLQSAQACVQPVISAHTPTDAGKRYCWVRRAELALAQGDPAQALDITDDLISSAPGMSPGRVITYLWKLKGEALAAMGRTAEACSLLRAAIENARAAEERFLLWRVHASLGRLYSAVGCQRGAEEELATASELIEELAAAVPDEVLKGSFREGAYRTLRSPP